MSWSWLADNIEVIYHNIGGYVLGLVSLLVNTVFDGVDALVSSLPSGPLFTFPSLPPDAFGVLNSLNYFFDVSRMAVSLSAVIGAHLSLMVGVAVLRFFQVMK